MYTTNSLSSFENSTSLALGDNESEIEKNIFEKLFKANAVSSTITSGEQL